MSVEFQIQELDGKYRVRRRERFPKTKWFSTERCYKYTPWRVWFHWVGSDESGWELSDSSYEVMFSEFEPVYFDSMGEAVDTIRYYYGVNACGVGLSEWRTI